MTLIVWSTITGQRVALPLLSVALFGFAILIAATYNAFGEIQGSLFESLPEAFRALLKTQSGLAGTPNGFLATGYRHPVYLTILTAFVIAASSGAMAREIERGTVFLLLSRPLHRYRLVLAKIAAMFLALVLFLGATLLGTWIGVLVGDMDGVDFPSLLLVQVNALFLIMAVAGYSFLISSVSSEGGRVISLAAGLAVVFFFVDYLATLWSAVEYIGLLSLFHYYDPVSVVDKGAVPALHLGVLGAVAVVGFAGALFAFQRRDIT